MQRSSPGVRRIAAILNLIADHPGRSFTLIDLVKALQLSRSTCHALLTGLVEVGYLSRTSDKAYVLGPSLIAIGSISAQLALFDERTVRGRRLESGCEVEVGAMARAGRPFAARTATWIGGAEARRYGRTS